MFSESDFARDFLRKGPPWLGDSHFRYKDIVKENGGRWNAEHKKWEARSSEDLQKLIQTNKWLPVGVSEEGGKLILHEMNCGVLKRSSYGLHFDRRDPKRSKLDPKTDVVTVAGHTRTYARMCNECGVLLDSRLQFGLECDCHGAFWKSCIRCSKPIQATESCDCPPAKYKKNKLGS